MKYNPAFLDEERLIASFSTRGRDLEAVLEVIREGNEQANQHLLLIGPRGIGKTTLVLRAAAELRRDPALAGAFYPIVFGEESYEVDNAATLWLEALFHLGRQTGATRWQRAYERLRGETDMDRLRTLALAELRNFSEEEGKRLVVIVENFNTIIDRQISEDEAWTLRHALLNEPRIMLLATATARFSGIDARERAMFDLFRVYALDPLASHECATFWHHITGQAIDERQGRAIEILTGGNPRLLTILSTLARDAPLRTIADDLSRLIDENTDYFKGHIDALSPQAQRVFVALADLWAPATAQELAERTRISVNTISAVLARLEQDGVVTATLISARRKRYQLSERLYNIYYLMRRRGGGAERVRFAVEFIAAYYDADALVEKLLALASDAVDMAPTQRSEYIAAFFGLYEKIASSHGGLLLPRLSPGFSDLPELSESQRRRLQDDLVRARGDQAWFEDLWAEWWDSHTILREGWALAGQQPEIEALWRVFRSSTRGEAPMLAVGQHARERRHSLRRELKRLRAPMRQLCRQVVEGAPSWADLVVSGVLAAAWLADERLFLRAAEVALGRWPDSPWLQIGLRWLEDVIMDERRARFVEEVELVLGRHRDSVLLPLVVGLLLEIEGDARTASRFYRQSPVAGRLPELARTLAEVHLDILDHEHQFLLEPRYARMAPLLQPSLWIEVFAGLGRFAAQRLARLEDAVEILEVGAERFPDSIQLQLMLGHMMLRTPERGDDGLAVLRRAVTCRVEDWQSGAAMAAVLAHPLQQPEAAMRAFTASWQAFTGQSEESVPIWKRVTAWLEPVDGLLPGHWLPGLFPGLCRPSRLKLEAELTRLLRAPPATEADQHSLFLAVLALAMRGSVPELLARLRGSPAAVGVEPLIVGLALVVGESVNAPHEVRETARDIVMNVELCSRLYGLVSGTAAGPGESGPRGSWARVTSASA